MNIKQPIIRYHYTTDISITINLSWESVFLKLDFDLLLSGGKLLLKCPAGILKAVSYTVTSMFIVATLVGAMSNAFGLSTNVLP